MRFAGTVPELMAHAVPRRYLVHLRAASDNSSFEGLRHAVSRVGWISETRDGGRDHYLLALHEDALLGDALAVIRDEGWDLEGCRDERSEVEEAFLTLTRTEDE